MNCGSEICTFKNLRSQEMLTAIHPKLPMRNKAVTRKYYIDQLGFTDIGSEDYEEYLMVAKDSIEIHFFEFFMGIIISQ